MSILTATPTDVNTLAFTLAYDEPAVAVDEPVADHTEADEQWAIETAPTQAVWSWSLDGLLFELLERPEISAANPDRFVLSVYRGLDLLTRRTYGTERDALLEADVLAESLQDEQEDEEAERDWDSLYSEVAGDYLECGGAFLGHHAD